MVRYRVKRLIEGFKVNPRYRGKALVAIPQTSGPIEVNYENQVMYINNWEEKVEERVFQDKYGRRKQYTLGYFFWKPNEQIYLL